MASQVHVAMDDSLESQRVDVVVTEKGTLPVPNPWVHDEFPEVAAPKASSVHAALGTQQNISLDDRHVHLGLAE